MALKSLLAYMPLTKKIQAPYTKAKAYINQYEKFEGKLYCLDSAAFYLKDKTDGDLKNNIDLLIQLYFNKNEFNKIASYVDKLTDNYLINTKLTKKSYSNDDAWTCYRIGEAFSNLGEISRAINYYRQAVNIAPYVLDFKNKYGAALASNNLLPNAEKEFSEILKENPKHVSALTNLGFVKLRQGNVKEAELLYFKALALDPDYESLLLNIAGLYAYKKDFKQAETYLNRILKQHPNNTQAKQALQQIKQYIH
jgi:tetratricopeptide (TPR) repeat protein